MTTTPDTTKTESTNCTKEKFDAYRAVQYSGRTNMFDISAVIRLSHGKLTKADCFDIMENYAVYERTYGEF